MHKSSILTTYLPEATKRQVYGQAEEVVDEILEGREEMSHLLLRHPEAQQNPHSHGE